MERLIKGLTPNIEYWLKSGGKGTIHELVKPETVLCASPIISKGSKLNSFSRYTTFPGTVAMLHDAHTVGNHGAILTSNYQLILSSIFSIARPLLNNPVWNYTRVQKYHKKISGVAAVITHRGSNNIAHVLADGLARIWLIKQLDITPDLWVVCSPMPKWLSDLFDLIGISKDIRVECDDKTMISAETMLIPSATGYATIIPTWARKAVHDLLDLKNQTEGSCKRVWISRRVAKYRKWIQEKEIYNYLLNNGFNVYDFENESIHNQIKIIIDSEIIAGPHGAGLAWTIATRKPGGVLIEVSNKGIIHPSLMAMTNIVNWNYLRPQDTNALVTEGDDTYCDIDIPVNDIRALIDKAILLTRV